MAADGKFTKKARPSRLRQPFFLCTTSCFAQGVFGPKCQPIFCLLQAMDGTTKRLKIGDVITNMFRSVLSLSPGVSREGLPSPSPLLGCAVLSAEAESSR